MLYSLSKKRKQAIAVTSKVSTWQPQYHSHQTRFDCMASLWEINAHLQEGSSLRGQDNQLTKLHTKPLIYFSVPRPRQWCMNSRTPAQVSQSLVFRKSKCYTYIILVHGSYKSIYSSYFLINSSHFFPRWSSLDQREEEGARVTTTLYPYCWKVMRRGTAKEH